MIHTPTACQLIRSDLKVSVVRFKRMVIPGMDAAHFGATEHHLTGKVGLFQSLGSVFVTVLPVAVSHGCLPESEILAIDGNVVPVTGWYGEERAPVDLLQGRWAKLRQDWIAAGFQTELPWHPARAVNIGRVLRETLLRI